MFRCSGLITLMEKFRSLKSLCCRPGGLEGGYEWFCESVNLILSSYTHPQFFSFFALLAPTSHMFFSFFALLAPTSYKFFSFFALLAPMPSQFFSFYTPKWPPPYTFFSFLAPKWPISYTFLCITEGKICKTS